ncbi:MAG: hypothetical protein CL558_12995 [Alphaproteobacteria bacterium]|nr:hypothetical protein [Alphaproteobacteria bacterium]OUT41971.1 MAG: hypothetical protein CBB62_06590 [Micavibrio sp. TMED2]MAS46433.1 hypothetical protein [Alphaproteobacteria bacterium]MAX94528.1 hypothetical protein [Alphaproteobacteria bacterium]MAX97091.1 hypothetical protein [Alphaproteobacteria bacterium]|tara:strand:+ start:21026 stop:23236 length:2211 start_codon:yes stop_codon:yes gene_type:complete
MRIAAEAGLTVTGTYEAGNLSPENFLSYAGQPAVIAIDVVLPASPIDAILFDAGASGAGTYFGVRDSGTIMRFRAGAGSSLTPATAVVDIPVAYLPFDGRQHRIVVAIHPANGTLAVYVDDWLVGSGSTDGFPMNYTGAWAGGDTAGLGVVSSATVLNEPVTAWPAAISEMRFYGNQQVVAVARPPAAWTYLAELTGKDAVFRFGSAALADPYGPGQYHDAQLSLPAYRSSLEGGAGHLIGGAARVSRGVLSLPRSAATDPVMSGKVAGRDFALLRGPADGEYWQFRPFVTGICGRPSGYDTRIDVPILAREAKLGRSIIAARLLGDNEGGLANGGSTIGLEGDESLKGQPVPVLFGRVWNAEPVLVNAVHGVVLICQGPANVHGLRVNGIPRVAGTAYASKADFVNTANAASAGEYRVWSDGDATYARLSGRPEGTITVDISVGASDADRTPGAIAADLITAAGELVDAESVAALDANFAHVTGYYSATNDVTYAAILASILADAGAYFEETRLGSFRVVQLPVPDNDDAVATMARVSVDNPAASGVIDLMDFRLQVPGDQAAANPVKSLTVKYRRNYRVMTGGDLGGDASLPPIDDVETPSTDPLNYDPVGGWEVRAALALDYAASDPVDDDTVAADYPLATDLEIETGLTTEAGAEALRDLLFARLKVERVFATAQVPNTDAGVDALRRGDVVTVTHPDFGFDTGKPMVVIGITRLGEGGASGGRVVELRLWG